MNPKVLTKLYGQLTACERLPLLIAASVRGDAAMFLLSETRLPEESEAEEFELPQLLTVAELAQVWHTVIDMQVKAHQGKSDS